MAPKKIGGSACGSIVSPSLILTCSFVHSMSEFARETYF